jgi:hypothetical protein
MEPELIYLLLMLCVFLVGIPLWIIVFMLGYISIKIENERS